LLEPCEVRVSSTVLRGGWGGNALPLPGNIRPRLFDGSHLDYPGMNQSIHLRSHQNDAIWRGMSSGNTLLAHAVGAGKTFTMAATGMKMKQAGLIAKPMYVVPNHMLEQFSREFMQLYPNAKLLVATKDDLARERRKHLTAKIASGEWDGIVRRVTA
jgi:N12 class adenine-specific DNA methylase